MKILLFPLAIVLGIICGILFYQEEPTEPVKEALIYEMHYYDYEMTQEEISERYKATLSDTGIFFDETLIDTNWTTVDTFYLSDSLYTKGEETK